MKNVISAAVVLALLGGTSALAAPQDDHRGQAQAQAPAPRPAPPQRQPGWAHPHPPGGAAPARAQAAPAQAQPQAQPQQRGPGWEHGGRGGAAPAQAQAQAQPQQRGPGWEHGGRPGGPNPQGRGPGWEHGGRPGQRPPAVRPQDRTNRDAGRYRYDPRRWQWQVHPNRHYHWRGPAYRLPYGFYPHSWVYGEIMPWAWYTSDYYIDDWFDYGLPAPPIGCEWVREGADAVLVDVYSGRVLSVEYGLFF